MKQLKNLIPTPALFTCLLLICSFLCAQPSPILKLYWPTNGHDGYLAPMVELCDSDDPCSNLSEVTASIEYDTIFDLTDVVLHGLWFSPDNAAQVMMDLDPIHKHLKLTITREEPIDGGGAIIMLPGIGIVDPIPTKSSHGILPIDLSPNPQFQVFPNPCMGNCLVRIDQPVKHLVLLDMNGRIRWQANDLLPPEVLLPAASLPTGVYVLRITTKSSVVATKFWMIDN